MEITGALLFVVKCLYFMLPAYIANMAPVLLKKLNFLPFAVDFGLEFRGRRVFGANKTLFGLLAGSLVGLLVFWLQQYLFKFQFFQSVSLIDYAAFSVGIGLLLGIGALVGDMIESFFKRQIDIAPGKPWIPFDQSDFVIGGLVFVSFALILSWQAYVTIIIISPLLHIAANHIGFWLKVRKEKW